MKNNKIIKTLALAACAILLVVGSVAGTLAYMTSLTGTVTNTFTVGKVSITLDETDVNVYGAKDSDNRVTENAYKLIPGHTYIKDPTIHIEAGSEACYLFIKVVNGISDIEETSSKTIAEQLTDNGWIPLAGQDDVYTRAGKIDASAVEQHVPVFSNFTIAANEDISTYAGAVIEVTAYAVQADGFNTAAAAWDAAPTTWTNP